MAILSEKTQRLKACVEALELPPEDQQKIIERIEELEKHPPRDVNHSLTQIIYFELIAEYPDILQNPNSEALKEFCLNDVDRIQSYRPQP